MAAARRNTEEVHADDMGMLRREPEDILCLWKYRTPGAEVLPKEQPARRTRRHTRTSSQVKKNRNRAMSMNPAYVGFLAVAAFCAVFVCMMYLRLQSDIVSRSENITALQQELSRLDRRRMIRRMMSAPDCVKSQ